MSNIEGKYSDDVEFDGNGGVYVDDIVTYPLVNYDMNAADRYGPLNEVSNNRQLIMLDYDMAFNLAVDRKNLQETGLLKKSADVVKAQMEEQVKPSVEQYTLKKWAEQAGKIVAGAAPTKSTILDLITAGEVALDNARVPSDNRFLYIKTTYRPMIQLALAECNDITEKWLIKGVIGMIGTLHVVPVPDADLPNDLFFLIARKDSVIAPKTIEGVRTHIDPPGMNGAKIEGHFRGVAAVKGKKANGVYALVGNNAKATAPSSITKGQTYTTCTLASGESAKYTLDGSDPRYSITAADYSATAIANPAAGTVLKIYAFKDGKYNSDVVIHTCV